MTYLVFLFTFSFSTPSANSSLTLPQIRAMYIKANDHEKTCKEMIALLKPYNEENNPLFMGYTAGANMLRAKHVINPISKVSWFNKGKKTLETAIKADIKDVDLRCPRFGIQS